MKAKMILLLLTVSTSAAMAQTPGRQNHFPLGTFHKKNSNINGISVGLYSGIDEGEKDNQNRNVHSNGLRLEAIGLGLLLPLIPNSPISENGNTFNVADSIGPSEVINGFNLSPAGTVCDCITNGISAGAIGQMSRQVNGISASIIMNIADKHNGIQLSMFNESYIMHGIQVGLSNYGVRAKGLQIGIFNKSNNLKGVQLGLWNINQKRKLPILNWSFKN